MMPSCAQTGTPIHFHSSTTSGSACLTSARILASVSPRQSPSSAILFEMSSDADWPWLAPDFFMLTSRKFDDAIAAAGSHCFIAGASPAGSADHEIGHCYPVFVKPASEQPAPV